jgi:hypothetical protein
MTKRTKTKRFFVGIGIMLSVVILSYLVIRPWYLHWGGAKAEVSQAMPEDLDNIGWTRAITINATPDQIWPWLVQWGQGRGGWYSYDWLENLFGFDIHTAKQILPEYQNLSVGDPICMARGFCTSHVTVLEQNHWLSWQAKDEKSGKPVWPFTLGLSPVDATHTRLTVRESFNSQFMPAAAVTILEIPDGVMEIKALNTVRTRAEGIAASALVTPFEIILWFAPLIIGLIAVASFANRVDGKQPLVLIVVSALVVVLITFLFPPLWLRFVLDLSLLAGFVWILRQPAQVVQPQPSREVHLLA